MQSANLTRTATGIDGTFGVMEVDGHEFHSLEPHWNDNRIGLSCIPTGDYLCVWHRSPRYGPVYLVTGVPNRTFILTHPGNVGGDKNRGRKTHTLGCILLGARVGHLKIGNYPRQQAVLASRSAVRQFFDILDQQHFTLHIAWSE